jgi:hypothetical protein
MYKIIGADQKEYGPVGADQLRHWVREGRVGPQTSVLAEGGAGWQPLSTLPEFADDLAAKVAAPPVAEFSAPVGLPEDILARDYQLDIGRSISGGWNLLSKNFGLVFGGCAIYLLIQMGMSVLANIPLIGILISIASLIVAGPFMGGVYYLLLKTIRGQPAEVSDIFAGFRLAFGHLLGGYLVPAIFTGLSMIPGVGLMAYAIITMANQNAADALNLVLASVGFVLFLIPAVYFGVSWMFTLPLVVDKGLDFWTAMGASRRMVGKHFWLVLGLAIVCGLINMAGFLACCVGLFFSIPIVFSAFMYAYESIFSASPSKTT